MNTNQWTDFQICISVSLTAAGDISLLELFLMSISFLCLKIMSVETNSDLKLK